jgi:type IV pilus assembly protein PilX
MHHANKSLKHQDGAALVVALIFLLLMTLLGTSSMRGATMQERMSGNMRDYNLGFQSAEAALRDGEDFLRNTNVLPDFDDTGGFYIVNSPNRPIWHGDAVTDGNGYVSYPTDIEGTSERPKYYIERLSTARPAGTETETGTPTEEIFYFRITAIGYGGAQDNAGDSLAAVVLSSVYRSR